MPLSGRVVSLGECLQRGYEAQGVPLQVSADPPLFLDVTGTDAECLNHSCSPNAAVQDVALAALEHIAAGEQITFDYSTAAAADGWIMECRCGAKNCRRFVVSDFSMLPPALQLTYLRAGAVPSFVIAWMQRHAVGLAAGIPEFPRFAPFTSALLPEYRKLAGEHQILSEFAPAGVLLTVNDPQISVLNGNLILRSSDFATQRPHYTFVGHRQTTETARALLEHARGGLGEAILRCVPNRVFDADTDFATQAIRIAQQPERDDYIFSPSAIVDGATGLIRRRHRAAERFLKHHPDAEFRILDVRQFDTPRKIFAAFDAWSARRLPAESVARARKSLVLAMALAPVCPMLTTAISVGDAIAAVAMNELCPSGAIDHFTFCDPAHHADPLLVIRTAEALRDLGVRVWNYQEATPSQAVFKSSWAKERYRYCQVLPA